MNPTLSVACKLVLQDINTVDFPGNRPGKFQKSIVKYTFRTKISDGRINFISFSNSGK